MFYIIVQVSAFTDYHERIKNSKNPAGGCISNTPACGVHHHILFAQEGFRIDRSSGPLRQMLNTLQD